MSPLKKQTIGYIVAVCLLISGIAADFTIAFIESLAFIIPATLVGFVFYALYRGVKG